MVFEEEGGVRYLTVKETCDRLGITRKALDGYVDRNQLTKYTRTLKRTVFFKESEVEELLRIHPEGK